MVESEQNLDQGRDLMRAYKLMTQAEGPAARVASLARLCEPDTPRAVYLFYSHAGADQEPAKFELVGAWGADERPPAAELQAADPIARIALASPVSPRLVDDVAADAAMTAALAGLPGVTGACVLLPLYSARHEKWQGLVVLGWAEPRAHAATERVLYEFLQVTLSETIAAERTACAYSESLVENEKLLARAEQALQESQRQRTMLSTLLDNLPLGVVVVRIVEDGKMEVVLNAGKIDLTRFGGTQIDMTTVVAYGPGEDTPLTMERMPAFIALQTGKTARGELELAAPDGSRILLEATATPMRYEGDQYTHLIALYSDVTDQRRAERERLAVQEQLLQVQALALAERSTPLIPIREDVLILPLVGTIDDERGRQILETLVNLGGRTNVRAAIIDVTGVRNLDTAAARVLLGAAQALRLRGVKSILTGIQASAAMTLVSLGVDFSAITVRGTLQDGVLYATQA